MFLLKYKTNDRHHSLLLLKPFDDPCWQEVPWSTKPLLVWPRPAFTGPSPLFLTSASRVVLLAWVPFLQTCPGLSEEEKFDLEQWSQCTILAFRVYIAHSGKTIKRAQSPEAARPGWEPWLWTRPAVWLWSVTGLPWDSISSSRVELTSLPYRGTVRVETMLLKWQLSTRLVRDIQWWILWLSISLEFRRETVWSQTFRRWACLWKWWTIYNFLGSGCRGRGNDPGKNMHDEWILGFNLTHTHTLPI